LQKLGFTKSQPAVTGRPAYPPKAMCKLFIYGYETGIRTSRKLERETHRNIEIMWLMDSLKPDHKTIAEFRRENVRPLQKLFREFIKICNSWDLINGEIIVVDGSKFKASNNKKNNFSRKKLDDRMARIDEKIKNYLDEMDAADKIEEPEQTANIAGLQELLERKKKYEGYKKQLDESEGNELSTVDPDARLMGNNRGGVEIAYNVQSAVDDKHDIIVEYDVLMNPSDQHQLSRMAKKVMRKLKLRRFTILADKGYYNGADLLKVKKLKVKAVVSKQKPSDSKKLSEEFHTDKFAYDAETDTYNCPAGQTLKSPNSKGAKRRNYFNKAACTACEQREKCATGSVKYRRVTRSQYAEIYEETDKRLAMNTELYKRRQQVVEHPFGTVKNTMHGRQFILRTRRKVCCEVALFFLGYNLKRVLKVLGFKGIMERLGLLLSLFLCLLIWRGGFPTLRRKAPPESLVV